MRKVLIGLGLAGALGLAGVAGMAAAQGPGGWGPGGGPPGGHGEGFGRRGGWDGPGSGWGRGGGGPPWMRGEMGERRFGGNPIERMRMRLQRGFEHFDRNLDGVIEWSEAQQVLGLAFARFDADGDGAITRADIEARIARRMERFPRFAMRAGLAERRTEITNRAVERFMGRFGKGPDGRVTREEFVAQFEPIYRAMNRTGDGRLTLQQVEEFLTFMRMLRG